MNSVDLSKTVHRIARERAKRALLPWVRRWAPRRMDYPLSTWRLARDGSGSLTLEGVHLGSLLERFGSPLHVVDAATLADNAARFTACPPGRARACEVYYSYKTNPVPGVLQALHSRGLGAEVVSAYELWLALRLGVEPSSIVYNGPAKSEASLTEAFGREIGLVNVNCREDLAQLAAIARGLGKRPRIGVRVAVPGGWAGQFGERVETGAALRAFQEALSRPELRTVALHAHLGGAIASREQLDAFVDAVLAFSSELRARLGLELEILDFGGNLVCPTVSPYSRRRLAVAFGCDLVPEASEVLSIDGYVDRILEKVEGHYRAVGRPAPRVFLEPGRAMTANAQMLLCRVVQVREADENGVAWAVLDAGMNTAESVRGEYHQLFPVSERPGLARRLYRLAGPTCTQADVLYPAWALPELARGDGLAIMDSGAYFVPYSTSFSYPKPAIAMVSDGRADLLRRAETFEDLVALDAALAAAR